MLQIDELVMRESVLREMDLNQKYVDMILYGFIDEETFEDRWHTKIILRKEGEDSFGDEVGDEDEIVDMDMDQEEDQDEDEEEDEDEDMDMDGDDEGYEELEDEESSAWEGFG